MHYRQTLASEVELEGVGVHSGVDVHLRLRPAAAGTGVVFHRTDRDGLSIPATLDYAGPSSYATVLERGGESVSTIEHLMAALYALRVDDVIAELDGPEVPILDGSSRPFVDAILRAGRREHPVPREYLTIVRPLEVTKDEKTIAVYPYNEYRVTYAIDFEHASLGYQELTASLWREDMFADKLAPARTFTFERDVAALRRAGLALGGSLDNAIVVGDHGIINPGLRFEDEFVRHKMLDLTGDLSLLGYPLLGHVVAYRAGHEMHARLARRIRVARDSWHLGPWVDEVPATTTPERTDREGGRSRP
ncbi:MAG: UDP-3-O-acyl-N-acetylglucosamine deacetylase [Acidobacteriota bacterium]|nr:UDP-3-O-acyl-N-acetylglucosamine deacetylase [Acidobacteriota bacterium]